MLGKKYKINGWKLELWEFSVSDDSTGGVAPWIGYEDEDIVEAMKAKILSLSVDKRYSAVYSNFQESNWPDSFSSIRTFVRAPPSGVTFDFDYSSVSSVAMALLQEDPNLKKMRWENKLSHHIGLLLS